MRIPDVDRESLQPDEQQDYDWYFRERKTANGPYRVLLHHPTVARRIVELGTQIRLRSSLSNIDRELITITAIREVGGEFEWRVHEANARRDGVSAESIDIVTNRQPVPASLSPRERLIVESARELCRSHTVDANRLAELESTFGRQGAIEFVLLVGVYTMIGTVLNVYDVEPVTPA